MIAEKITQLTFTEVLNSIFVILTSYFIYSFIIYPYYFHPLSAIPGPKYLAFSKWFILFLTWSEKRNRYIHKLHQLYGPIIRIGPNEVDISDANYIKEIYINNFDKTEFYKMYDTYGEYHTFAYLTQKQHLESRKMSNKYYSKTQIMKPKSQKIVSNVVSQCINIISLKHQEGPLEVLQLFQRMAMDVVAAYNFGESHYDSLLLNDNPKDVIYSFKTVARLWFWGKFFPQYEPYISTPIEKENGKYTITWTESQYDKSFQDIDNETLVSILIKAGKNRNQGLAEVYDHLVAAYNTTSVTLTFFLYELILHPEHQETLINELKHLRPTNTDSFTPPSMESVDDLPFLNAFLSEVFRIHAAIPGQEPRIVPKSGLKWHGSVETPPCNIPYGTIVTMQPWTLHRDSTIFPDPEKFDPYRWLNKTDDTLRAMNKQMLTFGAGVRMCIGMHLALEEIKMVIGGIFTRFQVLKDPNFDYDSSMFMIDRYTTAPKAYMTNIVFKPLDLDS
ncbi:hypothetical protein CANARDRAFT_8220 [[Candida] arabinofermentans NRRL YB-2248]|uniref:Cytochrome P450 n=1 Tax=[Candida] arabinofermentans NRRL YB-2248 TaxID=983967 RepID=A0A1E4T057_9ASCO|nr:hypothetical protein CANARDRAFT_8220 [[Candida] arabinofermentans NRRL YB-2248]